MVPAGGGGWGQPRWKVPGVTGAFRGHGHVRPTGMQGESDGLQKPEQLEVTRKMKTRRSLVNQEGKRQAPQAGGGFRAIRRGGRWGGRGESEKTQPTMGGPLRGVGQEASRPKELTERPQIDSGELRADLPGGSKAF